MRILWNETENYFQAELGSGDLWRDEMELVRSLGFKTNGPPQWSWHTSKISLLDKLRKQPPKSGLFISELALEKYNSQKQQTEKKLELKKLYETAKKQAEEAAASKWETYQDEETGITCFIVKPIEEVFTWKFTPPRPPDSFCFCCGDPVFSYEGADLCLWCAEKF